MASIIKEKSIGLQGSVKTLPAGSSLPGKRNLNGLISRFSPYIGRLSLSFLFIFLCLFLFVYCRTLPENSKALAGVMPTAPIIAELKETGSASSVPLPVLFPVQPEEKSVTFDNIHSIEQLNYPDGSLQGLFWRESGFEGRVYLTFDDGPNMALLSPGSDLTVTESILETLKVSQVTGAFFINGRNLEYRDEAEKEKLKSVLLRLIREGNLLGNHSYNHYNLARGEFIDGVNDAQETAEEYLSTQRALDEVLGFHYPLILVRPPYAEPGRTETLDRWLMQKRYYLVSLQFDSYDYAYSDTGKWNSRGILNRVDALLKENGTGGVLLLHELESTALLLPELIEAVIRENGYTFSTLDLLLENKYGRESRRTPAAES